MSILDTMLTRSDSRGRLLLRLRLLLLRRCWRCGVEREGVPVEGIYAIISRKLLQPILLVL